MYKEQYIKQVLKHLKTNKKTKQRIREDLLVTLEAEENIMTLEELIDHFGTPIEMAKTFMENLDFPEEYYGVSIGISRSARPFEYKSKKQLFGLPLVHINSSGRYGASVAKGIIAIGDIAIGLISVGGVSIGVLSIGGISFGLLAIGGVGIGGISIAGVAVGIIAMGAIAYGSSLAYGAITTILTGLFF